MLFKLGSYPVLYFFGAKHTNDMSDPQFEEMLSLWNEFLQNSKEEKIVLSEGNVREIPGTFEESIKQFGESGAIQWLAKKEGVSVMRPEPNDMEQRRELVKFFDPELVACAFIEQHLGAWFRHSRQSTFDEALMRTIDREKQFKEIYGFEPYADWLVDFHKKLFGDQPIEDKNFLDRISDPRIRETKVNEIIAARTQFRNEYIFDQIKKEWEKGKSIFIVYGRGHLDALKSLLETLG